MLLIFGSLFLGGMAEWLKAADLKCQLGISSDRGFKSYFLRHFMRSSSAVEQVTVNHLVVGSIPTFAAISMHP